MNLEKENKKSPLTAQNKRRIDFDNEKSNFRAVTEEVNGQKVRVIKGYPILFGVYGKPYRGSKWVERIDKSSIATVDFSKLVLLWNHDTSKVLARAGKNMVVTVDDVGVFINATLGDVELDNEAYDRVNRELVDGMSFHFDNNAMIASDWENKIDVITKINEIYEVSIVTFPAYEETVVITADGTDPIPEQADESMNNVNLACPTCTCPKVDKPCITKDYNCSQCDTCTCPMAKMLGNSMGNETSESTKQALLNLIETM
jgi:HK97 family phage prohead protease